MTRFRIHTLSDGTLEVTAATPDLARKEAKARLPEGAVITKIKVVKEKADG